MIYLLSVLGIWIFFAVACMILAKLKEFDSISWFFKGLLLGGFAFMFLLFRFED